MHPSVEESQAFFLQHLCLRSLKEEGHRNVANIWSKRGPVRPRATKKSFSGHELGYSVCPKPNWAEKNFPPF